MSKAKDVLVRMEELKGERHNWEDYWQNVAYYTMPHKAYFTKERVAGEKLPTDLYDGTAIYSNQVLAAGLHGYLTNPSSRWFSLGLQDKKAQESQDVKMWLKMAEEKIFSVLNSSNFNQQIHETYLDLGCFGTAVCYEEEDEKDIVRFYARTLSECLLAEDHRERINENLRVFELTAIQALKRWGDQCGAEVKKAVEKKQLLKKFKFAHHVTERFERDVKKADAKNKPFSSIWIDVSTQKIIAEGGYDDFPYFGPRFGKVTGDVYGYSPAMTSFSDIKMLNRMSKTTIISGEKAVNPPIVLPHDGYVLPFDMRTGKVNYKRTKTAGDDKIEVLPVGNVVLGLELEEQRRNVIKQNFFVDLFLLLTQQKNMTATEVNERVEEKMLILGPTLGRLMSELLDPIIIRTLGILIRGRHIEPPPSVIEDAELEVEYISPLAKAQKISEISSINGVLAIAGAVAGYDLTIMDNYDIDVLARNLADIYGINPEIVRSPDAVDAIRQERAKQMAMQQQMAMIQAGADAAKTGAEADRNIAQAGGQNG